MTHRKSIIKKSKYIFLPLILAMVLMIVSMIIVLANFKSVQNKYLKQYDTIAAFYGQVSSLELDIEQYVYDTNMNKDQLAVVEKSFSAIKNSATALNNARSRYDTEIKENISLIYSDVESVNTDMFQLRQAEEWSDVFELHKRSLHGNIVNLITITKGTLDKLRLISRTAIDDANTAGTVITVIMVVSLLGFIATAIYVIYYIRKRVAEPIGEISEWAKLFEEGYDEMANLEYAIDDEYADLKKSFNMVKERFVEANKLKQANENALRKLREEEEYKKNFVKKLYDEKREKESISAEAKRDGLTGLYNRRSFDAMVEEFLEKKPAGAKGALYLIDMDNFKTVNDSLGHIAGDEALKTLAGAMRVVFPGAYLGRYGGDEFIAFMTTGNDDIFNVKAQELCTKMDRNFEYGGKSVHLSVSVGVISTDGISDYSELYMNVDRALYYAKEHGRNQYKNAADLED